MTKKTLASLGVLVRERRGANKVRETAREIGIGVATLTRVESGRIPDLATFGKICSWLGEDPGSFLGFQPKITHTPLASSEEGPLLASAHLKADQAPQAETVKALAQMILLAVKRQPGTREDDELANEL